MRHFRTLEKQEQVKPQTTGQKEIIIVRTEMTEMRWTEHKELMKQRTGSLKR